MCFHLPVQTTFRSTASDHIYHTHTSFHQHVILYVSSATSLNTIVTIHSSFIRGVPPVLVAMHIFKSSQGSHWHGYSEVLPYGFLMFSGGREWVHWEQMG